MPMNIRTVAVEFLRSGPRHNQLLSPLTPYLAVCGDSPAGLVQLPYEQAAFDRRRDELRYAVSSETDPGRLEGALHQTGNEMAKLLGSVPGLPGALTVRLNASEILHLRIVLSASELALLPFELSKIPIAPDAYSDNWLLLQAHAPVCITRRNRSVRAETVQWPSRPRILFVAGEDVPFEQHRDALRTALEPWLDGGAKEEDWLKICEDASLEQVQKAMAERDYTHVHILAHGAQLPESNRQALGLSLKGQVVSGADLASALVSVSPEKIHGPTVVTLATCDSGGGGSVVNAPDVSVAHDLHAAGVPLVVASQFPLSVPGSIPFVETFYSDLLWGVHPLLSLYRIRLLLNARNQRKYHDWASLVVYEALPANLEDQLHETRYKQTKEVLEGALRSIEKATRGRESHPSNEEYEAFLKRVGEARDKLPPSGPYAAECKGLRAASRKRIAEVEYRLARVNAGLERQHHAEQCYFNLQKALHDYQEASQAFLVNTEDMIHRKATLHWLLGQALSIECVLGQPFRLDAWMTALFCASSELENSANESRIWGHGTIAELYLLRLADPAFAPDSDAYRETARKVLEHIEKLVMLNGLGSFPVDSTRRQFERYINWYSEDEFAEMLQGFRVPSKNHWRGEHGLVETAKRAIEMTGEPHRAGEVPARSENSPQPDAPDSVVPLLSQEAARRVTTTPLTTVRDRPGNSKKSARNVQQPSIPGDRAAIGTAVFEIEMLPAENGDCLWVQYGDRKSPRRCVIDCGAPSAARHLAARVEQVERQQRIFELFVLTHIDSDHISGVLPFFQKPPEDLKFQEIWFNGWKQLPRDQLGVKQAEEFSKLLSAPELRGSWNRSFANGAKTAAQPVVTPDSGPLPCIRLPDEMKVTVLSPGMGQLAELARKWMEGLLELYPDKRKQDLLARKAPPPPVEDFEQFDVDALAEKKAPRDKSVANGSSIALLFEFGGKAALFTGDAHAEVVAGSIRRLLADRGAPSGARLRLDALKLSHHGSANALTKDLLDAIECNRYLVSTDGAKFYHPDREAIARVIRYGGPNPVLYFNYRTPLNELWANEIIQKRFDYTTVYPPAKGFGLRVSV
jgi:CHAT domain/Metallo-beta-lactamase superfamily